MRNVPFALILFRLLLSPVMLLVALSDQDYAGKMLAVLLILGILSDVFDGIIARKIKISTDKLRKWDSNVDAVFLVSSIASAWLLQREIVNAKAYYIECIIALELFTYAVSLVRFQKLPSNHSYSSKLFAIFICLCLTMLFWVGSWGNLFYWMFACGIIAYLDNLLILFLLQEYKVDTKVFWRAIKIR